MQVCLLVKKQIMIYKVFISVETNYDMQTCLLVKKQIMICKLFWLIKKQVMIYKLVYLSNNLWYTRLSI